MAYFPEYFIERAGHAGRGLCLVRTLVHLIEYSEHLAQFKGHRHKVASFNADTPKEKCFNILFLLAHRRARNTTRRVIEPMPVFG